MTQSATVVGVEEGRGFERQILAVERHAFQAKELRVLRRQHETAAAEDEARPPGNADQMRVRGQRHRCHAVAAGRQEEGPLLAFRLGQRAAQQRALVVGRARPEPLMRGVDGAAQVEEPILGERPDLGGSP